MVKNHVVATRGRVVIQRLPAYAPKLNPVEQYMWGHLKTHEIANLIATQVCAPSALFRVNGWCRANTQTERSDGKP